MSKAERTKKYIIETVAPIFNKKGAAGTALSDITEATGLTKGAIYGNFKDKDSLALACFEYNLTLLRKGLYKSLALNGNAKKKLLTLLDFYEENYELIDQNGGCPLLNNAIESDDGYPLLKGKVKETLTLWQKEIANIINEDKTSGVIISQLDGTVFANMFIASIQGGIFMAKSMENSSYLMNVLHSLRIKCNQELN